MYTALYRRWRPQTFGDVIGQENTTKTLKNEIINNRLSHAYLFIGSRGTGKTTCARILAKAMNCPNVKDGEPCNECSICKGIDEGTLFDIVEIDAASNNGVDYIRDLREEANYSPAQAKYRVYIIDEVHMLSASAFNALLKILEEPPEHVKFILATTEVQKMPVTILSRCQRFDFKRIQPEDIFQRLMLVAKNEGVTLEDEAGMLIARLADGGMRDALSVMDQCMARSHEINTEVVNETIGIAANEYLEKTAWAIANKETAELLAVIDYLHGNSCDMENFCEEIINYFRNIMVTQSVKHPEKIMSCTKKEMAKLIDFSEIFTLSEVLNIVCELQNTYTLIKSGANGRTAMEMVLIKLSSPEMDKRDESIFTRLAELEKAVKKGIVVKSVESESIKSDGEEIPIEEAVKGVAQTEVIPDSVVIPEEPKPVQEIQKKSQPKAPQGIVPFLDWQNVLQELFRINKGAWTFLADTTAKLSGDVIIVEGKNAALESTLAMSSNTADIMACAEKVTGRQFARVSTDKSEENFIEDISSKNTDDPLSGMLDRAIDSGIKINIK